MSERPWAHPRFWSDPAAEREREARHERLADLLAAYVDDELPPETASQIDAHLVGCDRCRRDVQLQVAVRGAITSVPIEIEPEPPAHASAELLSRIAAIPTTVQRPPVVAPAPQRRFAPRMVAAVAAIIAAIAIAVAGAWTVAVGPAASLDIQPPQRIAPTRSIPLVNAALADYRRVAAADLPGRARDLATVRSSVDFPVQPLDASGLRLLGAWTTMLEGEPAAVLAYRWRDEILVQYVVPEQLFFRASATRAAASAHARLGVQDGAEGAVAFPVSGAGSIMVGPGTPAEVAKSLAP